MNIGLLTASLSRRAGGLYDATRHLAGSLHNPPLEIHVFGLTDPDTARDRAGWGQLPVQTFTVRGPRFFGYAPTLAPALAAANLDLLHVHGLWMYPSAASRQWSHRQQKPTVITPHGMLDPWAVRNARWKKRLAGWLYENAHLRGAACLHALCAAEAEAIRAYGLRNPICIIPNGIDPPTEPPAEPPPWAASLPANAKVLFYLGRLHPKKGLPHLLSAWAAAHSASEHAAAWHLVIAGWDQGGHEAELQAQAQQLGISTVSIQSPLPLARGRGLGRGGRALNSRPSPPTPLPQAGEGSEWLPRVHFVGPQFDAAKHASYHRADACILPSFSEGLPMTVLEAWSYGLPVLMTPQCNLPEGFQANAALRIDPEPERIAQGLTALFAMPDHERTAMGERGRALVAQRFTWPHIAQQMLSVYRWVLGQGEKPDCVYLE